MIALWIRDGAANDTPLPCWRLLLEAIASSYGGQNKAVADILAQQHAKTSNGIYSQSHMRRAIYSTIEVSLECRV